MNSDSAYDIKPWRQIIKQDRPMSINRLILKQHIVFLKETNKTEALRQMVARAFTCSLIDDPTDFETAVIQRELLGSTGIGLGVALPHATSPEIRDFFIITGIADSPVPWNAIDGEPVRTVFLIGIPGIPADPRRNNNEYLEMVAGLMLLIKDEQRRQGLFTARDPDQVLTALLSS